MEEERHDRFFSWREAIEKKAGHRSGTPLARLAVYAAGLASPSPAAAGHPESEDARRQERQRAGHGDGLVGGGDRCIGDLSIPADFADKQGLGSRQHHSCSETDRERPAIPQCQPTEIYSVFFRLLDWQSFLPARMQVSRSLRALCKIHRQIAARGVTFSAYLFKSPSLLQGPFPSRRRNPTVTFLAIALIAAVLGFSGIAGTAVNLAWICAVIGIILALVFALVGRRPPV
jgi:uncharacterized membrane protein YtjA (UPF0391 family)